MSLLDQIQHAALGLCQYVNILAVGFTIMLLYITSDIEI